MTCGQACGRGCPRLSGEGTRAPAERRGLQPRPRLLCGCAANSKGCSNSDGCPVSWRGLRRTGGSSPRDNLAIQVPTTPAGEVRWYVKSVRIIAGICHCYYGSRWRHCHSGNILPCSLVWASLDLAHEPQPRIDLLLGRALRAVHSELRQRLSTVRQEPRETLRAFISRFTKVRGTIPRMTDASSITAFHQGCMMKRCWRSWPRMTWKLSPRSSLWPTSAPELPRAVHGTRHHRPESPRRVARVSSPKTTKRRRRRTVATRGRRLLLRSSQPRLGARTSATSTCGHREATAANALCTPKVTTAQQSVARSSSS
jgi:hypothetical protein